MTGGLRAPATIMPRAALARLMADFPDNPL